MLSMFFGSNRDNCVVTSASTATLDSEFMISNIGYVRSPLTSISGGYTTPNSVVRNGRVFNLNLKNLSASHPTVETWNSCMQF